MPTLATTVDGLKLPNPFTIASSPAGTNLNALRGLSSEIRRNASTSVSMTKE